MGSTRVRSSGVKNIAQGANGVNTLKPLAAMPTTRAFDPLCLAFGLGRRQSGLPLRDALQDIARQLHVSLNDPHQHLVILGAATIGFKTPQQGGGVFEAQINFLHILEEFEVSKHKGLHTTPNEIMHQVLGSEV
jgi:hypothetical protein